VPYLDASGTPLLVNVSVDNPIMSAQIEAIIFDTLRIKKPQQKESNLH